jgi:hypothetical protein
MPQEKNLILGLSKDARQSCSAAYSGPICLQIDRTHHD